MSSAITEDCGCGKSYNELEPTGNIRHYNLDVCADITVDLLEQYKRPIVCYLNHNLAANIQLETEELQAALLLLTNYINAKLVDPNTCEYKEQLPIIQNIVSKIIIKGMCL